LILRPAGGNAQFMRPVIVIRFPTLDYSDGVLNWLSGDIGFSEAAPENCSFKKLTKFAFSVDSIFPNTVLNLYYPKTEKAVVR